MYVNQHMSSVEIGKALNCTHRTVLLRLEKMGIKRRTNSEGAFNHIKKNRPKELDSYEYMNYFYVEQQLTKDAIGAMLDVSPACVGRALKTLGIHIRDNTESKIGKRKGPESPRWKGGVTPLNFRLREYYQINISPRIRERDEYKCQLCGSNSNLHTHHINPFSKIIREIIKEHPELNLKENQEELYNIIVNDARFLDENNLVTYCRDCHLFIIHKYKKSISNQAPT